VVAPRIDHAQRRAQLVQAVWRIAHRDGLRAASVRGVAREAGLSMGSVRHFFSSQDELWRFAMREVIDKIGRRVAAGAEARVADAKAGRAIDAALELLQELLPLDDERRAEARIYAAFTMETADNSGIAAIRQEAEDALRQQCQHTLASLSELGHVDPNRDLEIETERLWALLDGLTTHILWRPDRTPTDRVISALRTHLADLRTPPQVSQVTGGS
jgi:AcrR family transcriptional regulator